MPNYLKLIPEWLFEVIRGNPRRAARRHSTTPFLVIGHRGSPCFEIENTMASFQRAVEQDGANGLEFDLCLTKDEQIVLWHDWDPDEPKVLLRALGFEPVVSYCPCPPDGGEFRKSICELTLAEFCTHFCYGAKDGGPVPTLDLPPPAYSLAITPKARGDEEKISSGLARLAEEDPTLHVERVEETKQLIIAGLGDVHLDVTLEKLKRKYGVDATTQTPRVAYRETVSGHSRAEGRHVKQSGGHGQYGICVIEVAPTKRGEGFVWEDKIFGGAIPQNFRASVQKGIVDNMAKGVVAGYPMVDVKVTLVDGKYHQVDSNDMAFQIAGSVAIRKGALDAGPVLLEPIVEASIKVPEKNLGDIMSDVNGRRGKIMGTEPDDGYQLVHVNVPESEMLRFALDLRSITQGRGSYTKKFSHYDEMPAHLAKTIIEEFQKQHEAAS